MRLGLVSLWVVVVCLLSSLGLPGQQPGAPGTPTAPAASGPLSLVPRLVSFSGAVRDQTGKFATGVVNLTFSLYELQEGGTPLWTETQSLQLDEQGRYTVLLGASAPTGLPLELFTTGRARWLGVQPGLSGMGELPRVLLAGVPYALKAADAETLGGRPLSAFQLAPSNPNGTASNNASPNGPQPAAGEQANEIVCSSSSTCKSGFIPQFASNGGSAAVSNSLISQSGTTVAVAGSQTVTGNLGLPNTMSPSVGVLTLGGTAFLHNFGGNPFVGSGAGNLTMMGTANAGFGTGALHKDTTGTNNSAFGNSALMSNTAGFSNSAFGTGALQNERDNQNSAFGAFALQNHTSGGNNSAFGNFALAHNIVSCCNSAFGQGALFQNTAAFNSAFGNAALLSNTSGGNNTAGGFQSLQANSTGSNNTAFGQGALGAVLHGSGNVALGSNAGVNFTGSESNNVDIGNTGVTGDSNTVRIGNASHTGAFIAGIRGITTGQKNAVAVLIDSKGQLGTVSSSRRFKYDIVDMGEASNKLLQLRPVTFRYKQAQTDGSHPLQYGLIAEEVAEAFPELVAYGADGQAETVLYHVLPVLLLNELEKQQGLIVEQEHVNAEQQSTIEKQKGTIAQQQAEIQDLAARLARLEALVGPDR